MAWQEMSKLRANGFRDYEKLKENLFNDIIAIVVYIDDVIKSRCTINGVRNKNKIK